MSQRGRGLLEVNPSPNPFFQTTSSDIGSKIDQRAAVQWTRPDLPEEYDDNQEQSPQKSTKDYGEDFSFLYARSSDVIGGKLDKKVSKMAACMDTAPCKHRKTCRISAASAREESKVIKQDVEKVLQSYKHNPKDENPLYTTSTNEYGKKTPSIATYVSERASRPQGFSKSFNGIKPKNSSLNTSLTKSTVHPKLDPQFM